MKKDYLNLVITAKNENNITCIMYAVVSTPNKILDGKRFFYHNDNIKECAKVTIKELQKQFVNNTFIITYLL